MPVLKVIELAPCFDQITPLDEMFAALKGCASDSALAAFKNAVLLREETASTYIGQHLAVPHARVPELQDSYIVAGLSKDGIDWPTEGAKAHAVILIGVPENRISEYLRLLQKILKWYKAQSPAALADKHKVAAGLEAAIAQ